MHILFLTDNFPPEVNASASRVYERACYWVKWGHEVTVITCAPNFPEGKLFPGYKNKFYQVEMLDGIKVVRVKTFIAKNKGFFFRTLDFISYMPMAILASFKQRQPDLVIATSPQFFTAISAWIISKFKRKPFIFELGDLWPESIVAVGAMQKGRIYKALEKFELFLYKQSNKVIALTQAFKDNLVARKINPEKIQVVINGVDLSRYSLQERSAEIIDKYNLKNKFVIGYIGTLGMAHGLENVLHAAEKLQHENDIVFMFVGAGADQDKLQQQAATMQLNNVLFIPRQSKQDILKYWSVCDLAMIHLKNSKVFKTVIPSKLFEAMAMGLPIILVAPDGEATKLIHANNSGVWLYPDHPAELASEIIGLKNNPQQLQQYSQNNLLACKNYSRELQAKKMLDVLTDLV